MANPPPPGLRDADGNDLTNWRDNDQPCPRCGAPTLIGNWWDDPPELGGECIGTLHTCTRCDWFDSR